jgi:hypothetical protein
MGKFKVQLEMVRKTLTDSEKRYTTTLEGLN